MRSIGPQVSFLTVTDKSVRNWYRFLHAYVLLQSCSENVKIHVVHDVVITKCIYAQKCDCKHDIGERPEMPTLHSGSCINECM